MPTIQTKKVSKKKKKKLQSKSKYTLKTHIVTNYNVTTKKHKITFAKNRRLLKRSPLKCDNAVGINRLLAPFNKFYKKSPPAAPLQSTMILSNPRTGLTPKEKNYVICSCQQRSSRYARLKCLAAEAERTNKIFLMCSNNKAIRNALIERGWVEKIPPARMNLSTIRNTKYSHDSEMHLALERLFLSNLVEKCLPSLIWNLHDDWESANLVQNRKVIHNKFKTAALWSTKQGLCSSVRNNQWYYIENVADVVSPRTYNSSDEGEKEEFDSDYKLTACTSLLKWVLSMVANDRPIFVESGNIGLNVIVFALNRCKEYLFQKQNKDIDKSWSHTPNNQWNSFLKKYYILIAKQDTFKPDKDKLPLYLGYAKFMIKEIHKYRPQLSCEGCHNIWIIKPAHCSRGRGIRLASKLAVLNDLLNNGKYVFQKYIEESMLIHETKFDIRQYYLVTSTFPLVIWMYQDCYLKFSSQKYNLKNFHESIHLTNNAVQKKYKNCTNRHPELPQHNMWSLDTFKEYLIKSGRENVWDTVVYPGMKKSIVGIMLSCQASTSFWKNRFELYGCDFILDKDCKPWLIEINSGPDLNPTTKVTAEICPAVLTDVIKVVIDRAGNPKASTGKFECIYRQNLYMRSCGRVDDLSVQGVALPNEYFYRGNLQADEHYSIASTDKKQDISTMLKRLKMSYDSEKADMVKIPHIGKNFQKVSFKNLDSKGGNKKAATIMTDQLDNLVDRLTSKESPFTSYSHQDGKKTDSSVESCPSSKNFRHNEVKCANDSVTDIKSSVAKPCPRSQQSIDMQFDFSHLDDGPVGKGSGLICLNPAEKKDSLEFLPSIAQTKCSHCEIEKTVKFETQSQLNDKEHASNVKLEEQYKQDSDHDFLQSTKKILSFLSRKRKEYAFDEFVNNGQNI